ncbi:restriction endonuclease subunit S [Treponema zioleckii]|uniref:restriction endonuclease subunit S n=1 Tax=Treponema zioleckii TaxID=331680 RepID=UPI00168BB729|nr:restriction endonuclease subunit S [Treponema zioleckii]
MKQSGIDWIGEIPDDWKISKAKTILRNKSIKNHPEAEVLSLYRDLGIVPKNSRDDNHNVTSDDTASYKFVQKGELVLNKMKTWQGSLAVSDYEGIVSPAYYVCEFTNQEIDKKYIHYLLRNKMYAQEFERLSTGLRVGQWDLNIDDFLNTPIVYPPKKATQQRIAKYLDKKVSEIDSIIEESKKSIEEYKAWKQSVIFEAVTGKNLNCKKKDSGIEWIGEVPEGWEVKRLKNLFDFGKGLPITKENLKEAGVSVISYGQIHSKQNSGTRIDDSLKRFVDESYLTSNSNSLVHKSDFIFADTSEDLEGCGNCVYVDEEQTLFAGYHTIIFSSKIKQSNKYLAYLFKTDAWRNQIRSRCNGVKLFSITKRILSNVNIVLPPLPEQEAIAKMLDSKCAQIDSLIAEKESLIADLTEYKKSLIFEVVTGKRSI